MRLSIVVVLSLGCSSCIVIVEVCAVFLLCLRLLVSRIVVNVLFLVCFYVLLFVFFLLSGRVRLLIIGILVLLFRWVVMIVLCLEVWRFIVVDRCFIVLSLLLVLFKVE